jgi:hypothetical protein
VIGPLDLPSPGAVAFDRRLEASESIQEPFVLGGRGKWFVAGGWWLVLHGFRLLTIHYPLPTNHYGLFKTRSQPMRRVGVSCSTLALAAPGRGFENS